MAESDILARISADREGVAADADVEAPEPAAAEPETQAAIS